MNQWQTITLGDIARGFTRYRPFILSVAAMFAIAVLLPGEQAAEPETNVLGTTNRAGLPVEEVAATDGTTVDTGVASTDPGGTAATARAAATRKAAGVVDGPLALPVDVGPDCDPATGRLRVPARTAPPCTPFTKRDNGGATAQGVSRDSVTVVLYQPVADPATTAALTAAGANNSLEDYATTFKDYVDYFNHHYQTYGRTVKVIVKPGSGKDTDDAAAKADAIDIATSIKPFAVFGSNNPTFVKELAARKIICVCTTSQPQEFYDSVAPYGGYTTLMSSTQGYIHRAEYVGKRLAGRKAKWAGDATLAAKNRSFGLLYYETEALAYKSGADFFERELLGKYNVRLTEKLAFNGPPDYSGLQEQARPLIQRLKESGVTSVIYSGDPISPAVLTGEATRQNYFPEWIITGSALTDIALFGRTYDQAQWSHAFGVSFLTARLEPKQGEAYRVHLWHHGREAKADNQYAVIYPLPLYFFTGLTMAGPKLTPESWANGLFNYPVTGKGLITQATMSFGKHGLWPMNDYTAYDDVTEIWWDQTAQGPDELDNQGVGMYRYVDGGKRYLPGEHPRTDPKAFDKNGTVLIYSEPPPSDGKLPTQEHKHYYG